MTPGQERLTAQMVEALQRNLRQRDERPAVPEAGRLLWRFFLDLDGVRRFGSNGPEPIGFVEIEAWARLNRYPLAPWHVDVLRAMDAALIQQFGEELKRRQGDKGRAKLTPAFFDARFAE